MTSDRTPTNLSEDLLFDLLEHPEAWPEDPEKQAELAELLELHLAMKAHADDVDLALGGRGGRVWWRQNALAAAAAVLLVALPTVYAVHHTRKLAEQRRNMEHYHADAQKREQERIWIAFLNQTRMLLTEFDRNPPICDANRTREDRTAEHQLAMLLKNRSQVLFVQDAPTPEARRLLENVHGWLQELSLEDTCMTAERVNELRQLARSQNLPDEVARLSRTMSEGTSR